MVTFEVFWGLEGEFGQPGQDFASQPQAGGGQQMHDLSYSYLRCKYFGVAVADPWLMEHEAPRASNLLVASRDIPFSGENLLPAQPLFVRAPVPSVRVWRV